MCVCGQCDKLRPYFAPIAQVPISYAESKNNISTIFDRIDESCCKFEKILL